MRMLWRHVRWGDRARRVRRILRGGVALVVLCCAPGCSDQGSQPEPGDGGPDTTVGFHADIQPIFDANCAECHAGAGASGSLDLSTGNSYASLVGVASVEKPALLRVAAGHPEDSYLVMKLEGDPGIDGSRMPFGGTLLPVEIDRIRTWVTQGAVDN
jgi:hypothetical protein